MLARVTPDTESRPMRSKHLIAGLGTVAAIGGGTAGALAAGDDDKQAEQAVLADAAKRLGVGANELRSALSSAEDAQLDAAVKAGKVTQAQADAVEQHRQEEGMVLGLGHGDHGHGGPGARFLLAAVVKAIGISEMSLMDQLHGGKTLTAIAKAHGKTLVEVKAAAQAAATSRLDAELKAGRITRAEYDEEVAELDEELDRLSDFGEHDRFGHHGPPAAAGRHDPSKGGHTFNGRTEALLSGDVAAKVRGAALDKVSGTVERVETNVDSNAPYEAHIRKADGTEVEVQVTKDFTVAAVNSMPGHP